MSGKGPRAGATGGSDGSVRFWSLRTGAALTSALEDQILVDPNLVQQAQARLGQGEDPATPIRLHLDNPHYFEWRGRPTVLDGKLA